MDEAEAVRRARQGDREGFRWLVERDGDLVRRTAYLLVRDPGLAEDLAQECFLAAWQSLSSFRTATGFRPWVLRILMNKAVSHRRKRRLLAIPFDLLRTAEEPAEPTPDPTALAIQGEEQRELGAALATLPEEWRRVLVLRYYAEFSVPEIAEALDMAEGTVKSRLHRALVRLREALSNGGETGQSAGGRLPRGDGVR